MSGEAARAFLAALAASPDAAVATPVLLVVAHPDDETLALGGQMARLSALTIVTVTDGAPADLADARAYGFGSREAYASARAGELARALARAGGDPDAHLSLDIPDQQAAHRLVDVTRALAALISARRPEIVITHALEGGHPDHDATGFAVRAARHLTARGGFVPDLVEAPFYHARGETTVRQRFAEEGCAPETVLALSPEALARKRAMLAAHASQAATLAPFDLAVERLRPAASVETESLPNGGDLLYARYPWGLDGATWLEKVAQARTALGLPTCL